MDYIQALIEASHQKRMKSMRIVSKQNCPKCNSEQVQMLDYSHETLIKCKCRDCKHCFELSNDDRKV